VKRGSYPLLPAEVERPQRIIRITAPGQPLSVKKGDKLGRGGLIAAPFEGHAALYSGINGTVTAVREDPQGSLIAITRADDVAMAEPLPPVEGSLADMTEDYLRAVLLARGVTPPPINEKAGRALIIDCTGDDPYNESPSAVCEKFAGDVVGGAKILMKLLSVRRCVFAVSKERLSVADGLDEYIPTRSKMLKVELIKSKYPASEPHLLVSSLFNLEINADLPMEKTGFTVVSPMLCKAVFDAMARGIPHTDTIVTVAEEALDPKSTYLLTVPLGTELDALLLLCGILPRKGDRLTTGGGYRAKHAEPHATVTDEVAAVTLLYPRKKLRTNASCVGCGRCDRVCPVRLMPSRLYEAALKDDRRLADRLAVEACIGCGCCSLTCPARLPLAETISAFRNEIEGGADGDGSEG